MGNVIIGVMRKAMKDVEIKGYVIPKGWCFLAYLRSVHLDKIYYDSPYKFNPWRWQVRISPKYILYTIKYLTQIICLIRYTFLYNRKGI